MPTYYMGEYQIAGGDLNLAAQQLQLALASPHISQIQRQRYQARLDEVRDYLMSMRKRQIADNGDGQAARASRAATAGTDRCRLPGCYNARHFPGGHSMRATPIRTALLTACLGLLGGLRERCPRTPSAARATRGSG